MKNLTLIIGGIYGLLSVILGAFGAHAFKKILSVERLESFETGVRYQIYAAFFLLIVGYILKFETSSEKWISILMIAGAFFLASSKSSRTRDAPKPTNISTKSEPAIA